MGETLADVITLPEPPFLFVPIGPAGIGKTRLLRRIAECLGVSRFGFGADDARQILWGDRADQTRSDLAHLVARTVVGSWLEIGWAAGYDATSVTAGERRPLIDLALAHDVPAVAAILRASPELVRRRNHSRSSPVSDAVVDGHLELVRDLRRPDLTTEGFTFSYEIDATHDPHIRKTDHHSSPCRE